MQNFYGSILRRLRLTLAETFESRLMFYQIPMLFKRKALWGIVVVVIIAFGAFLADQVYETNLAHTTFDRYYAFRGCVELIDKTDTYADCKLANGQTIKLVLINGKWYLDGDGPGIW
jgi:hypothetical protein